MNFQPPNAVAGGEMSWFSVYVTVRRCPSRYGVLRTPDEAAGKMLAMLEQVRVSATAQQSQRSSRSKEFGVVKATVEP